MTKTVYILTQEGRGYSDEGLEIVRDNISKMFNDDSDLLFMAGQFLNDPDKLIKRLSGNKDGYLVLSMEKGAYYFNADDFPDIIDLIEYKKPENPWESLNRCILNAQEKYWPKKESEA